MTAYFVSDIHLKTPTESKALLLERFLFQLIQQASAARNTTGSTDAPTHLFLVGDIFDLWIGSHRYFRRRFEKLVGLVRDLVRLGVEVHFFEGNHDLHLTDFWQGEIGVRVHTDSEYFDLPLSLGSSLVGALGGKFRVRVEHGDLINPDDSGYRFLRWLLRTPVIRGLALNLPEKLVTAIGERASAASRDYTSGDGAKAIDHRDVPKMIHTYVKRAYHDEPFDLIITGHVHIQDDFTFEAAGKVVRSVNLGSWFESAPVFLLSESASGAVEGRFIDLMQTVEKV